MADEDVPRLTERFFTRDKAHGTGLGLAIVDILVRAVGGDVHFGRSTEGGLSVRVLLVRRTDTTTGFDTAADVSAGGDAV